MNKKPFLYRFGVFTLGKFFKFYYHPRISGIENIPKEDSIILAGNHIHLYDQCHILISTKRYINYMAKKEYFDSKKTRWFITRVGCISVDRTKKDDGATNAALSILDNGGAIGIYPEGTRNALKQERIKELYQKYFKDYNNMEYQISMEKSKSRNSQVMYLEDLYKNKTITLDELYDGVIDSDGFLRKLMKKKVINEDEYLETLLLPLKFGAVSMASKTDSKIIPVIVTGDYKFHSKNLKVNIGKPFDISGMELGDANALLRKKMIALLKENLKNTYN